MKNMPTANATTPKKKRVKPCKELLAVSRKAGRAIKDYDMIQEGDHICVAVSGGKDSISLLHVLKHRQLVSPVKFKFTAVHIDFEFSDFDPTPLIDYLQKHEFNYLVEKCDFLKGEEYHKIDCYWWSRNRRKALFQLCEREGMNKIALGHHLDDIVETILLNQFYRGETAAMKPNQDLFGGKIHLIRPLCYEREAEMKTLADKMGIDAIGGQSKCADDDTSHRMLIKDMLRQFENNNRGIVKNIFNSLSNIKYDYLLNKPEKSNPPAHHTSTTS